jgi:phage FluMu gp28-like protein
VVACGRRFGKTETGKILTIDRALAGRVCWWISPTYRMADDVWRSLKTTLDGEWIDKNETLRRIDLPGGGVIRVQSGHDPDALRGAGLDLAVLDEAAFLHPDVWHAAIRPALVDRRGEALFLSTPNGRNWFWGLYMLGQHAANSQWQSWRFPTSANPLIDPAEIDAARDLLPEHLFKQEYEAEFLADAGAVFRNVDAAATALQQEQAMSGHRYVMGLDLARRVDYTVCVVLDISTSPVEMVSIDRFNQVDWAIQVDRIKALALRFQVERILVDQTGVGDPVVEQLQRELFD